MSRPVIRCAIYTRKSSDEGLEQSFNALDAQAEACAAYVASQRHEGWKLLPARYDDGGISGGTLGRPGLQRLLADIDAGRVDMVVVYKIDRPTRALADFARLVERLEAARCSFVSVTQAFNMSSSMGRLTLNVLLSFAQFEREVTAERIRDKIAASKKKGLWMGGLAPLGYDPHPDPARRELVENDAEAVTVRRLFALYLAHGCLNATARAAKAEGLRSKRRVFAGGRAQGGAMFSRGHIHRVLTTPVYRGLIRHRDRCWPGRHPVIVDEALWQQVQERLQTASARRRGAIAAHLDAVAERHEVLEAGTAQQQVLVTGQVRDLAQKLRSGGIDLFAPAITSARIGPGVLEVQLDSTALATRVGLSGGTADTLAPALLEFTAPFAVRRRGVEMKIVTGAWQPAPDKTLLRALRTAHRWADRLKSGASLRDIAASDGRAESYVARVLPLATLSPRLQQAIVTGTQPLDLTHETLVRTAIPLDWADQERRFGPSA